MFLPLMRERLRTALAGAPDVLDALLSPLGPDDPAWDLRPDPDRFTLREVLAHLTDYEAIWRDRLERTCREDTPELPVVDPGELAARHDYGRSDVSAGRTLFRERRAALVAFLGGLSEEDWTRVGRMGGRGPLTAEEQAAFVVIHDGYHAAQIAHWLTAARRNQNR